MSSRTKLLLDDIDQLPAWAQKMARKYYAGEASHFLLYNNIYDLVRSGGDYISLPNYLQRELVGTKHLLTYNRSEGIKFGSAEAERAFAALLRVSDPLAGRDAMRNLPKDPARALPLIDWLARPGKPRAPPRATRRTGHLLPSRWPLATPRSIFTDPLGDRERDRLVGFAGRDVANLHLQHVELGARLFGRHAGP